MNLHLVVHTENREKLRSIFQSISLNPGRHNVSLHLHCKGYIPWSDPDLNDQILTFKTYTAFPTEKSKLASIAELILNVKDGTVILVDEDNYTSIPENLWDEKNLNSLRANIRDIIGLNLDTKYQSLKWFIIDLFSQKLKRNLGISDDSEDFSRYSKKIESPLFYDKIIYLDGGMGDHVMSLPLLEKISESCHICCKYPVVYEHLKFKSHIYWYDELFGGYDRFVYSYGSSNNSNTIIDAFFEMYGYERLDSDVMKYNGKREPNPEIPTDKKIALFCTSAAKINGIDSNKNWDRNKWIDLSNLLIEEGYYVIQVGSKNDVDIPNANSYFFEKPLSNLASLIESSDLWISVDTFFHHFASAIKPNIGVCLTPFYNDHAKHPGVKYIEKDCGKNYWSRRWWLDSQQPERKECMDLIEVKDVLDSIGINSEKSIGVYYTADETNIHLLEFSAINSREFSKFIFVNFEGPKSDLNLAKLNSLVDKNIIDSYEFNWVEDLEIFERNGCYLYLKMRADSLIEFKDVSSAISNLTVGYDFGIFEVVRYFKNLNLILDCGEKESLPCIFKTRSGSSPSRGKDMPDLKLHDLELTHSRGKDKDFCEFFETYYYYSPSEICYNNIKYKIKRNEIWDLEIKGLIKTVCLSNGPMDNCSNWRIFQPMDRFENGINYDLMFTDMGNYSLMRHFDVLVVNRPVIHFFDYLSSMRDLGLKVIVNYDDALPISEYIHPSYLESYLDILKIIRDGCDAIMTTCGPLKVYFESHGPKPVSIIKNIAKPGLMTPREKVKDDKIHIAWYGSTGHLRSLKIMSSAVLKILNEFENVCFDLYADDMKLLPANQRKEGNIADLFKHERMNLHSYNYNFYEFQKSLDLIDINLAPIEETHVNLCKSDIRIQLAAYKGIPSIVTNFGEYKKFARLNDGALVCEDNEWYEKIKSLIIDEGKRNEIGAKARETIEKYYDYDENSNRMDFLVRDLINTKIEEIVQEEIKPKIIDTFIFGGELDMLKMRLEYLYDSVDHFIIVESDRTFSGLERDLVYEKNKEMFSPYLNKIHYLVYSPDITGMIFEVNRNNIFDSDFWKIEDGQRDLIKEEAMKLGNDRSLILHGDLDEFPNKEKFDYLISLTEREDLPNVAMDQDFYYYSPLNFLGDNWSGTVAFNYRRLQKTTNLSSLRHDRHFCTIRVKNGGYHFSYFSTPENIRNKIQSFSHQEHNTEENTSLDSIREKMHQGLDLFGRPDVKIQRLDKIKSGLPKEFFNHSVFLMNVPPLNELDSSNKKGITWLAKFDDYASMGILSQRILENLKQNKFSCKPIIGQTETSNQKILEAISRPINTDVGIMFSYPDMVGELSPFNTKVIYTGVDTTGGISNFAENSNKADYLLTPSNISKQRMIGLGVNKPIIVFPHGIDPEVFRYSERKDLSIFRFLYVGECSDRKGIFQLLEAFLAEFGGNQNVELHIKSNSGMLFYGADRVKEIIKSNPNIFWHIGNDGHDQVIELYNNCHAYVYPSRADTFGMTLIEAMSCGLPVISTSEPGATELIRGKYRNISSKMVPVNGHPWMLGEWGEADVDELRKQMLSVYSDYERIMESGELEEFSDYIRSNYSWDSLVQKFEDDILPEIRGIGKKTKEIADGPYGSTFH